MGCLFGYCGAPRPGLLDAMAERLGPRCARGLEAGAVRLDCGRTVEVGHGIAPWQRRSQLVNSRAALLAHAGVLFDGGPRRAGDELEGLLRRAARSPENVLPAIEGAFTLALAAGDALHLVRDHAGVKVLYWTVAEDRLIFASEVRSLLAAPGVHARLRPAALLEYLTFSFVPGAGTTLEGVHELEPGACLAYVDGRVTQRRPGPPAAVAQDGSAREHAEAMRAALDDSVAQCLRASDEPPGTLVSGGLDSSAVLATACRQSPGKALATTSVHFGEDHPNENAYVRLITERYRTDHRWLEIRPAPLAERMRETVRRLDEPIGDPVTLPNDLMAEACAERGPVLLNGEGGDPCLGGPKNVPMLLSRLYGPPAGASRDGWLAREYLASFQRCYEDLEALVVPEVLCAAGGRDALVSIVEPYLAGDRPAHFLDRLMWMNIRLKGASLILVKVDKLTSSHGVLALPPLFSRRVIETAMACPPDAKLLGASEKQLLKDAVADRVPAEIIERPKSGMRVPVSHWFRDELASEARRVLSRRRVRRQGLLRPDYVDALLAYDRDAVPGRHGLKIWMLMTLSIWYEQVFG